MMRFITEEYLRDIYRKEPFNTYHLEQGQRLTPGAAQYLSDKRIKIDNDASKAKVKSKVSKEDNQAETKKELKPNVLDINKKLCYKLKSIEAAFLVTSSEILKEDIILAQSIINLRRKISNIRNVISGKGILENIHFKECTGINSMNCTSDIDDCFEVTEFHMQLEKSNSILKIHMLRCSMWELKYEITSTYESKDENLKKSIINNINLIINSLSQLICLAVGGKECQRKI